jgi:hypothetical protein
MCMFGAGLGSMLQHTCSVMILYVAVAEWLDECTKMLAVASNDNATLVIKSSQLDVLRPRANIV